VKLLTHIHDERTLSETSHLLRRAGIPVFVQDSAPPANFARAYRMAVFVCLDRHLDDARALLQDPGHRVADPVDVDEYDRIAAAAPPVPDVLLKGLLIALVICAATFAMVLWLAL
jgi:hypothetical protein